MLEGLITLRKLIEKENIVILIVFDRLVEAFFKHFFGDDVYVPKEVAWIKINRNPNKKIVSTDLLTEEDVKTLINTANNIRDKTIISLLYDTGIRAGELLNMKVKDVDLESTPQHIQIDGKTGKRQIAIVLSVPYLSQYFNTYKNLKSEEYLWQNMAQSHFKGRLTEPGLLVMIKRVGEDSKINKRIYPHLFRHSRATHLSKSNKISTQQLNKYFGWKNSSTMVDTYISLSGKDTDDAILEANGIKINTQPSKLQNKIFPKCTFINGIDSIYCSRCSQALDTSTAIYDLEMKKKSFDTFSKLIEDPKNFENLIHEYLLHKKRIKNI